MTYISLEPIDSVTAATLMDNSFATGFPIRRSAHALTAAMPDAFIQNSAGTRFEL